MMTKMIKTTKPTSGLLPMTKEPNVSTTPPASAFAKIDLVVETLIPRRNNVNNSNNEGNIENCNGSCVFIDTKMTKNANEKLIKIRTLNNHPGNGIINMMMMKMTPNKTAISLNFIRKSP